MGRLEEVLFGWKTALLPLLFVAANLALLLSVLHGLEEEKSDSVVLKVAARQTLLHRQHNEEIVLASLRFETDHAATRALLRDSLRALEGGGQVLADRETGESVDLPPAPNDEVVESLRLQQGGLDLLCARADRLLAVTPGEADYAGRLRDLHDASDRLEAQSNRTVRLLTDHSRRKADVLAQRQAVVGAALLALALFLGWQCLRLARLNRNLLVETRERLRAEEGRRELGIALENAAEGIARLGPDGRIFSANPAFAQLLGQGAEDLVGTSLADRVLPDDHPLLAHASGRMAACGKSEVELRCRRPGGSLVHIVASLVRVSPSEGRPGGDYCFVKDSTARKEAESALAASNRALLRARNELEARVEARTNDLSRANRDLETLLHVASHDLKEPVRGMESFSRMLLDRHAGRLDEKGQDLLRRIDRACGRLRHLLDDIARLARARQLSPPGTAVEGRRVVDSVLGRLESAIRESGARIEVADELPSLSAQETWATEAVYNLVGNALKFTGPGHPPELEIAGVPDTEGGGIVVRDRGPGVPPSMAERIFGLFQRGVGREIEGTGAGLAIVRQIAERHGGWAWVEAREGGGSQFFLTFGPRRVGAAVLERELQRGCP